MKLEDKGPIVPAPRLSKAAERVAEAVRGWPAIVSATHWNLFDRSAVDGADFYVGERELGHIHLDGELHLATTRALRDALLKRGLAEPSAWDPRGSWVVSEVRKLQDVDHAIWLFRLNYDRLSGTPAADLLERISRTVRLPNAHAARA